MPRAMLLHRSRFQRDLIDPKCGISQGALVLYTNGLWFYHDGTCWAPNGGLDAVGWIKLFQCNVPILEEDEFGIIAGLSDDHRVLDDTWREHSIRECLNSFIAQFPEDYFVWPDGECLHPLRKSRQLTAKRRQKRTKVSRAVEESISSTAIMGKGRRHALMAKTIPHS